MASSFLDHVFPIERAWNPESMLYNHSRCISSPSLGSALASPYDEAHHLQKHKKGYRESATDEARYWVMQSAGWDCVQWSGDTGSYREDTLRAVLDTVLGDLVKTAFAGKVSLGMLLFPTISTHFCYAQLKRRRQWTCISADAQWVVLRAQRQLEFE